MKFINLEQLKILKKLNIHLFGLIFLSLNIPLLIFSFFYPKIFKRRGVFFGGIPFRSSGGPTQKIKLLIKNLGETFFNFKCIYIISGSLRVPIYILKVYKLLDVKIIINQNGVFYPSWYKKRDLNFKNQELLKYNKLANLTLFQSNFAKKSYAKFVGTLPVNYRITYNAVDLNNFFPIKKIEYINNQAIILVAGNFYSKSEDYRVINAIKAIKILKIENYDLKLIIAGNLRKQLLDKINNENLNYVQYVGGYDCSTANKIFNSASIYLHLHYMGCCDNILLEMMACGQKIIALDNGGNKELLPKDLVTFIPCKNNWYKQVNPSPEKISYYLKNVLNENQKSNFKVVEHVRNKFSIEKWILFHKKTIDKI